MHNIFNISWISSLFRSISLNSNSWSLISISSFRIFILYSSSGGNPSYFVLLLKCPGVISKIQSCLEITLLSIAVFLSSAKLDPIVEVRSSLNLWNIILFINLSLDLTLLKKPYWLDLIWVRRWGPPNASTQYLWEFLGIPQMILVALLCAVASLLICGCFKS